MVAVLKTPILFLVSNRPIEAARVFETIRRQQPQRLFVASDGATSDDGAENASRQKVRAIATRVDWPCELKVLFRETALGDSRATSGAISWFFDQVEEGIILEETCLPHDDFFPYCETLLERYRDEPRVATIIGTHLLPHCLPYAQSHYVSKYFQKWGWATWRRTWQQYDADLTALSKERFGDLLEITHTVPVERGYWNEVYAAFRAGVIDTWDFQLFFSSWRVGANHVAPARNLISIIGAVTGDPNNFAAPIEGLPTRPLRVVTGESISLEPDLAVDNLIFYVRFLQSLNDTYWLEQVISPELKLGESRIELIRKDRVIRQLELEVAEKRLQLLAATKALSDLTNNSAQMASR